MKVVVVDNEVPAYEAIINLLHQIDSRIEVVKVLGSVQSAIDYFAKYEAIDLLIVEPLLAYDQTSDLFEALPISVPIIFTSSVDQYAVRAFKLNSLDYLIKPITKKALNSAITKFRNRHTDTDVRLRETRVILEQLEAQNRGYRSTFLIDMKEFLVPVAVNQFAFFCIKSSQVRGITFKNETFVIDQKMEELEDELDPGNFYRANRQFIVQRSAFDKIHYSLNGRLLISLKILFQGSIVISKAKSRHFKNWLTAY